MQVFKKYSDHFKKSLNLYASFENCKIWKYKEQFAKWNNYKDNFWDLESNEYI
jgi:hypothetical protein